MALILLSVVSVGAISNGPAEESPANKPAKAGRETPKPAVTPEMELQATEFVTRNHPELLELLGQLKATNPTQYQQAVRDLSKAATTLATTEKNDPKKYVLDLKAWQVNSHIQVLAARLAMSQTQELKDELKAKLLEQVDLKIEQQKLDRERAESRLKKLNESIDKLEESRDQEAAKAFDRLTRSTAKPAAKKDNKANSGSKAGSNQENRGSPK